VLRSDWTGPVSARVAWLVFLQVERQLLPPTENRWLIKSLLSQWILHTDRACPVTPALGHSMGPPADRPSLASIGSGPTPRRGLGRGGRFHLRGTQAPAAPTPPASRPAVWADLQGAGAPGLLMSPERTLAATSTCCWEPLPGPPVPTPVRLTPRRAAPLLRCPHAHRLSMGSYRPRTRALPPPPCRHRLDGDTIPPLS
jgi:hypothetical protein